MCFSSSLQTGFTMYHEANTSPLMFAMILIIGLLLGVTIIILAFRFVFNGNLSYISILKAYGYNDRECYKAMYSGYHVVAVISFVIGTVYQVLLLSYMFQTFSSTYGIEYRFDFIGLLYAVIIFIIVYITVNVYYYNKINRLKIDNLNVDLG